MEKASASWRYVMEYNMVIDFIDADQFEHPAGGFKYVPGYFYEGVVGRQLFILAISYFV